MRTIYSSFRTGAVDGLISSFIVLSLSELLTSALDCKDNKNLFYLIRLCIALPCLFIRPKFSSWFFEEPVEARLHKIEKFFSEMFSPETLEQLCIGAETLMHTGLTYYMTKDSAQILGFSTVSSTDTASPKI